MNPRFSALKAPRLLGAGAFAASLLMLAGCSTGSASPESTTASAAVDGGDLTVGIGPGAICVDPQQTFNFSSAAIARTVVDSLTDQDPETGEIVPWLAESWEVNDDATQYVFTLRDDVTFSDGTPFDADSVAANLDYIKTLGAKSSRGAAYMSNFVSSTVLDPTSIQIDFSAPTAQFLVGTSTLVFGMLSESTVALTPEERCQGSIVGTGPFVLDSYVQDQEATVSKRADYDWASTLADHEGAAYLDTISFQFQPVPNVRAGALSSGQTDVALVLETQDVPNIEASGATVMAGTMPGMPGSFIANTLRPQLADPAVRQAINIAFDRAGIVETVLGEYYTPAYSIVTSNLREYTDYSDELAYDPEAASDLLDEAGWEAGSDGVRSKDGVTLDIALTYTEDFGAYYTSLLQLVQQQLNEIGFNISLVNTTQAGIVEMQQTQDFDLFITTITESDPDMVRSIMETRITDQDLLAELGLPELFSAQQAATDPTERSAIWAEIQEITIDNGLVIPLFQGTQLTGYNANVTGPRYDFKSMVSFYDTALTE